MFTSDDYLTLQQIATFYSRTAAKKSITQVASADSDGDEP